MSSPFQGHEVEARLRPAADAYAFDLDHALSSVVALESRVPADAFTARILGTERLGNGVVISEGGLVLTMAYLITEASEVVLTLNDGRRVHAHVLGFDGQTGWAWSRRWSRWACRPCGWAPPRSLSRAAR